MEHYRSLDSLQLENACVTIGSFDGVHIGHQEIIHRLVQEAQQTGVPAVVLTFFPHPAAVLGKSTGAFYLSSPEERAALLASLGVDLTVTLHFTPSLAQQTAEEFLQQVVHHLHPGKLIVGYDFSLGRNRQGTLETLRELGKTYAYQLEVIPPVTLDGEIVSSTRVRHALENADIALATRLLGRWYSVSGEVTYGDQRGGKLGIPTANLDYSPDRLIPPKGVYATWAHLGGRRIASVTNIGVHPTFDTGLLVPKIEAHLLDFSGNVYTSNLTLEFIAFLRPEKKFDSVEALLAQISTDIHTAREVLDNVP